MREELIDRLQAKHRKRGAPRVHEACVIPAEDLRRYAILAAGQVEDVPVLGNFGDERVELRDEVVVEDEVIFDHDARDAASLCLLEQREMREIATDGALADPVRLVIVR